MDPDHPIIEHPCRYSVVGFCFHRTLDDTQESFIDLTLQREQTVRRLRFLSPQAISIGEGFPHGQGLFIADIRRRGLEGLTVEVGDFESSGGAIQFLARAVVDLDAQTELSAS